MDGLRSEVGRGVELLRGREGEQAYGVDAREVRLDQVQRRGADVLQLLLGEELAQHGCH